METLPEQFEQALTRIEINGVKRARAIAAHSSVRTLLETSPKLVGWGVDTVLIGSYARNTGIYPGRDVDVFTKLTALSTAVSPERLFAEICELLTSHYGERAEPRNRSVKIQFTEEGEGFSVDVVPAVHSGERWAIPAHDRTIWTPGDAGWTETDPEKLTDLTQQTNEQPKVAGRGAYVPIVKLARQARRHHRGDAKPGGLYIELAVYHAFAAGLKGESFAEIFADVLRSVATQLASGIVVIDPARGTPYSPAPIMADLMETATIFSSLASTAERALTLDRCASALLWQQILGTNDRGSVFPLPPGCDEHGHAIAAVSVNSERGSNEAKGFA